MKIEKTKMNMFKYYFLPLLTITLITCQYKTKTSGQDEDVFALIEYPAEFDTIDCSKFSIDWQPYPCLDLDKKTIKEIDSLYGKPLTTYIDTLYYGREKNDRFYDPEIAAMISNVPFAKITYTYRKVMGYVLILFFIEQNKDDIVFYGYHYNPHTRMLE